MVPYSIQKIVFSGFFSSLAAVAAFVAIPAKPAGSGFMSPSPGGSCIPIFRIKMARPKTRSLGGLRYQKDQIFTVVSSQVDRSFSIIHFSYRSFLKTELIFGFIPTMANRPRRNIAFFLHAW